MKVITLMQPWATLVVIGAKNIETRSWNTKYRGDILIHASSKKPSNELMEYMGHWLSVAGYSKHPEVYGAIIGKVELLETEKTESILFDASHGHNKYNLTDQEKAFGDYCPGRYGWILGGNEKFKFPIFIKGMLGLWNFPMTNSAKEIPPIGDPRWKDLDPVVFSKMITIPHNENDGRKYTLETND